MPRGIPAAAPSAEQAPQSQRITVPATFSGQRVDQVAAALFSSYSRSLLARWLTAGALTVDGAQIKPKQRLNGGELLVLDVTEVPYENWSEPQAVDFAKVYEDSDLLVINKPAGLVVHPGAGNFDGTLVNGLLAYRAEQAALPRAGIVHRLDKDTSGLLLVAASVPALTALSRAIAARQVGREYLALVAGHINQALTVEAPIGRDPNVPTRQRVHDSGRPARTHVAPVARFAAHTLVSARLETGRTHQIRVHLAHLGHPLVGDERYGGRPRPRAQPPAGLSARAWQAVSQFERQALHAAKLSLAHPISGVRLQFEAAPPADFEQLRRILAEG